MTDLITDVTVTNKRTAAGLPLLIKMSDLKSGGFIKENKMRLKIELVAGMLKQNDE